MSSIVELICDHPRVAQNGDWNLISWSAPLRGPRANLAAHFRKGHAQFDSCGSKFDVKDW